jgi:hypothetical protein
MVEPPPDRFEWQDRTIAPGDSSELAENLAAGPVAGGVE